MALNLFENAGPKADSGSPGRNLFAIEGTSKLDVSEKPKPKQKVETPLPERGVRAAARQVGAAAETAYSVAEGAVVWPISKAAGLTGIIEGGEEMKRREEATAEFLTHKPIMKETEAAMEKVGKGFEFIETPQRIASDELERKGHHRAAYLTKLFSDLFMFKAIHAGGVKAKARIIRRSIPKDVKVSQADINRIARTVPTEKQAAQARAAKTKERLKTGRAERGRTEHFKKPTKSAEESAAVFKREGGYPESEAQRVRLKRHLTAEGDIGRLHELKSYPGKAINLIRTELKEQKVEGEFRQPGVTVPRIQKGKEFGAKLTEGERGRLLAGETLEKPKTILRKGEPKYTTPKATGEPEVSYRIKEKGKPAVSFKKGEAEPWEPQKPAKAAVTQADMAEALARNKAELELKPAAKVEAKEPWEMITPEEIGKKYGVDVRVEAGVKTGEYSGGRAVVGGDTTPQKAFSANWVDRNASDFTTQKAYPANTGAAAHEIVHGLFSKNPELGHVALKLLKDLGVPEDVAFESLVDMGGVYLLEPKAITNKGVRSILSDWLGSQKIEKPELAAKAELAKEIPVSPKGRKEIEEAVKSRRVEGDSLLDALDLADDLAEKNAEISKDGIVTLYHRTSKSGAEKIIRSGKMVSKEDRLFFGTHPTGQIEGYGDAVVRVYLPLEKLELNDVFSGEAHVTMESGRIGTAIPVKAEAWKPLPKPTRAPEVGAQEVPAKPSPRAVTIQMPKEIMAISGTEGIKNAIDSMRAMAKTGANKNKHGMYLLKEGDLAAIEDFVAEIEDFVISKGGTPGDVGGIKDYALGDLAADPKTNINTQSKGIWKPVDDWRKIVGELTEEVPTIRMITKRKDDVVVSFEGRVPSAAMSKLMSRFEQLSEYEGYSSGFAIDENIHWGDTNVGIKGISESKIKELLGIRKIEKKISTAKPSPGSVFIKNKQFPFREYREFTRGKNEGKVEIILPDGKKKVVEKADVAKWPGRTEGTTLETLGFQTIYETMAKTVATRKAKEKTPRGKPIDVKDFTIGKVVKQRTWKHGRTKQQLTAPPIWELEKKIVKDMPNLREKPLGGWFENPIRTFGELGSDAKELFYRPMKEAEHRIAVERKATDTWANSLFKGSSAKSRRRIGAYAIAQQKRGEAILKKMGVRKTPKLTLAETKIYKDLRQKLEQYYTQLNEARQLSGKETFGKVDNYFTFLRDLSTLEEMGFNPITTKGLMIQKQFQHLKTTPFRFERARAKMGAMPVELDAIKIFKTYSEMAVRHIHKSPAIAKGRELMLQFPEGKGHWVLKEEKPRTAKFLADWLDFQAGQRPVTNIPKVVEKALFKLNQNLAFSILSANLRSAIIQPSALVQTFAELGPKWTAVGIKSLLSPEKRNFAFERSNVLLSREYDVAVTDAIRGIKSGRVGDIKKIVGRIGFKPLQLLDIETARATWQGAYEKALKELNYTNKKAVNYADDVVTRTQASAMPSDIAPIQRTALGKFVTTFQTFVINEWGFLTKDVLGIKNANINNKHTISRLSRLIVGTTLFNMLYEDVLGINSPFSTPVRAFMEAIEEGETLPSASLKVALELAEKVPVVGGGARYGSHPLGAGVELLGQTALEVSGKKKPKLETAGKWLGVPGSTQIAKTARAKKRGETPYGQVLGVYTKNKGKRLKSLKGLKNLKGLD